MTNRDEPNSAQPERAVTPPPAAADVLTPQEREVVGLAASVGAGCDPCAAHHLGASEAAGVGAEELVEVVVVAHRVAVLAADQVARETLTRIGAVNRAARHVPTARARELAALGAAVAANAMALIEEHAAAASAEGLSTEQIAAAVGLAQEVQANAASIHARKTRRLLGATGADRRDWPAPPNVAKGRAAPAPVDKRAAASAQPAEGAAECGCEERGVPPADYAEPSPPWGSMLAAIDSDPAVMAVCCGSGASQSGAARGTAAAMACDCAGEARAASLSVSAPAITR